jgi:hypothetical protein
VSDSAKERKRYRLDQDWVEVARLHQQRPRPHANGDEVGAWPIECADLNGEVLIYDGFIVSRSDSSALYAVV